jgi:hypothetical protein
MTPRASLHASMEQIFINRDFPSGRPYCAGAQFIARQPSAGNAIIDAVHRNLMRIVNGAIRFKKPGKFIFLS